MDPNNNNQPTPAPTPTTVGGVTFGGSGNASAPAQPEQPTPAQDQSLNPVDPIIQSTGEEFDAVMNGTTPTQNYQAPVPSNLEIPVTSPTHFDTQNTVRPIVQDPGVPGGMSVMNNAPTPEEKKAADIQKQVKKLSTMSVIFGILTAIFIITSIVGLVYGLSQQAEITEVSRERDNYKSIVTAVEETTGVTINSVSDVPVYKATTGYIYLSSWNIKIRIPDNLTSVSYILNENYRQSICFNAVGKGVQYFPDFANIALNPGRMGCLTRIATTEGEFDAATGVSFGTKVFTYKDYSYFYTGSIDYSKDEANLGLEHTAVQYIKNMLTDNIEQYE
ncbi:MAG: hypothetical protein Q4E70_01565 [Candidatus Saccharibacteria bacterium]|nr:hypothetical protein [Candidatus Saccharibacteria bacterium]